MPDKDSQLPQDHREDQKESLDDQPYRVEPQHFCSNSEVAPGIGDHEMFQKNPETKNGQAQLQGYKHHNDAAPIQAGHGKQDKKELRIESELIPHIGSPAAALIDQLFPAFYRVSMHERLR